MRVVTNLKCQRDQRRLTSADLIHLKEERDEYVDFIVNKICELSKYFDFSF